MAARIIIARRYASITSGGARVATSVAGGSTTLTLSDHTSVTFIGVTGLNAANFV